MSITEQVEALRQEGTDLYEMLRELPAGRWDDATPFKGRTVNWVVKHLHDADRWAFKSITEPARFRAWVGSASRRPDVTPESLKGHELLETWISYLNDLCSALDRADEAQRYPWFGPDMGLRMMTTARQMETWAHGQDIYDLLAIPRVHKDRIRNICHIGVRTYGWTFHNRKQTPPKPIPFVQLQSPSGQEWTWNDPSTDERISGSAVDFAHVVTQGRNVSDTRLHVVGPNAEKWMSIAQCFAGPPEDPPTAGHRTFASSTG